MKMETNYICELCRASYSTSEECQSCKEGHIKKFDAPYYFYKPIRFPSGFWFIYEDEKGEAHFQKMR